MTSLLRVLAAAAVVSCASAANAELLPVELFAQKNQVWAPALSPFGERLAMLERHDGDDHIAVYRVKPDGVARENLIPSGPDTIYFRARWANDDRLLVSSMFYSGGFAGKNRLRKVVAMNTDGTGRVELLADKRNRRPRFINDGLIHLLPDDPVHVLARIVDFGDDDDSSVYRININTGDRTLVEEAARGQDIYSWHADWSGTVRYAFGTDSKNRQIMLVRRADGSWHPLHKYELFDDGRFFPLGYSYDDNTILVLSSHITGRASLFKFDLRTGDLAGKVFEHDQVDLDSLVVSEVKRKAVAVSYTLDHKENYFLDDDFAALKARINARLPGKVNAIASNSRDEQRLIVRSSSPQDPGTYYLFDVASGQLTEIGARLNGIDPAAMAAMRRVTYEARDSLQIPAYLTVPKSRSVQPGPAVILPHGGPRTRDILAFDAWAQFLASRGYVVLQPNFRGSRGYGERYESLGHGTWGRAMQDDLADAAEWLVAEGLADPQRICIAGASYGGYAALMGVIRDPGIFQCAASLNGVSDIRRMLRADGDYDTSSSEFKRVAGKLNKRELDLISPLDRADEIRAPVLLVHGEEDDNVSVKHARNLASRLARDGKPHRLIVIPDEGHSFLRAESTAVWLSALEDFLAEAIGTGFPDGEPQMADTLTPDGTGLTQSD